MTGPRRTGATKETPRATTTGAMTGATNETTGTRRSRKTAATT
jgi:hypothetical protein